MGQERDLMYGFYNYLISETPYLLIRRVWGAYFTVTQNNGNYVNLAHESITSPMLLSLSKPPKNSFWGTKVVLQWQQRRRGLKQGWPSMDEGFHLVTPKQDVFHGWSSAFQSTEMRRSEQEVDRRHKGAIGFVSDLSNHSASERGLDLNIILHGGFLALVHSSLLTWNFATEMSRAKS